MRDGTAEPVSRDQILRRERGQGNTHFSCSAALVQDGQPYPDDVHSFYMCNHIDAHGLLRDVTDGKHTAKQKLISPSDMFV